MNGLGAVLVVAVLGLGWLDPHARVREGNRQYASWKVQIAYTTDHYRAADQDEKG